MQTSNFLFFKFYLKWNRYSVVENFCNLCKFLFGQGQSLSMGRRRGKDNKTHFLKQRLECWPGPTRSLAALTVKVCLLLGYRMNLETNLLLKWVGGQMVSDVSWAQASFGFTKLLDLKINLKFQGKLLQRSLSYFMWYCLWAGGAWAAKKVSSNNSCMMK